MQKNAQCDADSFTITSARYLILRDLTAQTASTNGTISQYNRYRYNEGSVTKFKTKNDDVSKFPNQQYIILLWNVFCCCFLIKLIDILLASCRILRLRGLKHKLVGQHHVEFLRAQRHLRVQIKSQELHPSKAVSTLLGLVCTVQISQGNRLFICFSPYCRAELSVSKTPPCCQMLRQRTTQVQRLSCFVSLVLDVLLRISIFRLS